MSHHHANGVPINDTDDIQHGTVRVHLPQSGDGVSVPSESSSPTPPAAAAVSVAMAGIQPFDPTTQSDGAMASVALPVPIPGIKAVEPIVTTVEETHIDTNAEIMKNNANTPQSSDASSIEMVDVAKLKKSIEEEATTTAAATADSTDSSSSTFKPAESPEVRANLLSRLTFWWLNGIMAKGGRKALMQEDMYEVNPEVDATYLSNRFEQEWAIELERMESSKKGGPGVKPYQASIPRVIYRIFRRSIWIGGVTKAVYDGFQFFQPILMEWMLGYIADIHKPGDTTPDWHGYLYAMAIGLNPIIATFLSNLYFRTMATIGLRVRAILTTQLYKKSLRLSPGARQNMSAGQIVNMMSTDASKIEQFSNFMHLTWSTMEQVCVAIALLIRAIGPPALAGVGVVLILIPTQAFVMRHLQQLRRATVKYTDSRIKLMNEILQGIRVLKVYAWEGSFLQKLMGIRLEEIRFVRKVVYLRAWNSTLMQASPILMALLAFMTLALSSDNFDPKFIFSSLILFNLLRMPLMMFPTTIAFWSDARIGLQRITAFLLAEELHSEPEYVETNEFAVKVTNANFAWEKIQTEVVTKNLTTKQAAKGQTQTNPPPPPPTQADDAKLEETVVPFHLDGVNFTIPKGSLTVIVGSVGAGKSSLLSGILGEMKRDSGSVQIAGTVGYCPQQAWIMNSTLKNNILFGKPFDQSKYDDAIKYCALQADIDVLPAGDLTEIGEKGINLSGGQKQRVNLARSVYFDADIIMLDDPLSAVDSHVSKYLFNSCICDKLKNKTRILVTHQLQYVSSCDQVLYVENGKITEAGTYQQLMSDKKNFFKLMSTYVGEEEEEESPTLEEIVEVTTNSGSTLVRRKSSAKKKGLKTSKSSASGSHIATGKNVPTIDEQQAVVARKTGAALMQAEERIHGGVPLDTYLYYIRHCGGFLVVLCTVALMGTSAGASAWNSWWLNWWSADRFDKPTGFYLGIYAAAAVSQIILTFIGYICAVTLGVRAARELHNRSFKTVMRAPMAFFDTTPIGRIINRFSKDQDVIDTQLMDTLSMIISMGFSILSTFIMIGIVLPWFFIALLPILFVYWFVQKSYRSTSRELKRLESISRSPIFAHFSETLTGLATIRAYRAQKNFADVNEQRMNANNRSYYLLVLTQRWLSIRVETIGALISFCAAIIIIIQRDSLNASESGVALTYAISCTSLLNWVIRQTVEAENSMNSVERSKFYTDGLPQEAPAQIPEVDEPLKESWPQRGAVEFKNLKIRYREGLPLVLHGISLNIKGGERVGIVGRTGAGKSSLMVALFRIVEAAGGSICIDGVDISKIGLDALRSKLAIIPQDPVLYSGTVRSNLDPFNQYSDDELWSVLEKAYLKDAISGLEKKLLDPVSENGENFSVGQRCQMCLARAMLRNARVLIMDEATASVDMETDSFIQNSLRKNFNSTLLTIAHRLNTICDYDKVLVLSFGLVKEFDSPANLLRDPNSVFSSMVNETGEVNAALLRNIAFKAEQGVKLDMADVLGVNGEISDGIPSPSNSVHNGEPVERSKIVWHETDEMDIEEANYDKVQ